MKPPVLESFVMIKKSFAFPSYLEPKERSLDAWLLPGPLTVLRSLWSSNRLIPGEAASSLLSYESCPGWERQCGPPPPTLHPGHSIAGGLGRSLGNSLPLAILSAW